MRTFFKPGLVAYVKIPELRKRFLITLGFLLSFRLLAQIPVFNVGQDQLNELLANNPLLGLIDLFAGGEVLTNFSVVAAGILPYLTALLLTNAAAWLIPPLRALRKSDKKGRERIEFHAKILTIPLAFAFAWGISHYIALETGLFPDGLRLFTADTFFPTSRVVLFITTGSILSAWMVDQISEHGIGAGSSVVLLTASSQKIVNQIRAVVDSSENAATLAQHLAMIAIGGTIIIIFGILLTKTVRRVPIIIPRVTQPTTRTFRPKVHHDMPLKLIVGGILPVSAATGILALIQFTANLLETYAGPSVGGVVQILHACTSPEFEGYWLMLAVLVIFFTYVYNFSKLWRPFGNESLSIAETLRRQGSFIEGIRPGRNTEAYLEQVMGRITFPSAIALAGVVVGLPCLVHSIFDSNILVTVLSLIVLVQTLDEVRNKIEVEVLIRSYDILVERRR